MNDQFKNEVSSKWGKPRDRHGRVWAGLLLLAIGGLWLLKVLNILLFPWWFFTWPMLLIGFGVISALRRGFRGGAWFVMLAVGSFFLFNEIDPTLELDRYIAPVAIIALGLMFIFRPRRNRWHKWANYRDGWHSKSEHSTPPDAGAPGDRMDFIDITSVFGGVKKNVISKSFRGGDIVSFMGGQK